MPVVNGIKPVALAKDIAKVFRSGKAESTSDDGKRPILHELVDAFDRWKT